MADLSITQAQVQPGANAPTKTATAGETITPGMPLYVKAADSKLYKADADATATADCVGIALSEGAAGQYVTYQYGRSTVTLGAGAAPAQGTAYYVSTTAGGICPEADLGSGDYMTYLGIGDASNGLVLGIHASGVAHV